VNLTALVGRDTKVMARRDGTFAGTHGVQGDAEASARAQGVAEHGAQFNGSTSVDRVNYFETLSRRMRTWSLHRPRSGPDDEQFSSEGGPRFGNDVVRNEFERGENSPQGVLGKRIEAAAFRLAQLREIPQLQSQRYRARASSKICVRSTRSFISRTMWC